MIGWIAPGETKRDKRIRYALVIFFVVFYAALGVWAIEKGIML